MDVPRLSPVRRIKHQEYPKLNIAKPHFTRDSPAGGNPVNLDYTPFLPRARRVASQAHQTNPNQKP